MRTTPPKTSKIKKGNNEDEFLEGSNTLTNSFKRPWQDTQLKNRPAVHTLRYDKALEAKMKYVQETIPGGISRNALILQACEKFCDNYIKDNT